MKLEREDEESVAPHVIAPFFPQVGVACGLEYVHDFILCVCVCCRNVKKDGGWWSETPRLIGNGCHC